MQKQYYTDECTPHTPKKHAKCNTEREREQKQGWTKIQFSVKS